MSDTAEKGRASVLPPITHLAARIREHGLTIEEISAEYSIGKGTLRTKFSAAGYSAETGNPIQRRLDRPEPLTSGHVGGGGQYVAGGDYQGLPTKPVQYRQPNRPTGLDWDAINANYAANGGQLDPSVWPKVKGEVVVMGIRATRSHRVIHTIEEHSGADYDHDNPLGQATRAKRHSTTRRFSDDECRAISLKYRDQQASIRELADEYGVSASAIQTALRFTGERARSRAETNRLRKRSA